MITRKDVFMRFKMSAITITVFCVIALIIEIITLVIG